MALGNVGEFVRQNRSELILAVHHPQQSQMQAQVPPGQGKRIDARIPTEQDGPCESLVQFGRQLAAGPGCGQKGLPDGQHVLVEDRVLQVVGVAVELARDAVADLALGTGAHVAAITHCRQLVLGADWRHQHGHCQQ